MEEPNFLDVFVQIIIFAGYVANFFVSIQLMNMPDIDRVSPVALNWCLTIVFGISTVVYFLIQGTLLKFYCHKKDKSVTLEKEKVWIEYNFNYMEFSLSLFLFSLLQYASEGFISIEDITGYNQVQLLQIYIFSRIVITVILLVFSFYSYKTSVDDFNRKNPIGKV